MEQIEEQRFAITAELDLLRAIRGAAALDGTPITSTAIAELEDRLEVLDDASSERTRPRRRTNRVGAHKGVWRQKLSGRPAITAARPVETQT